MPPTISPTCPAKREHKPALNSSAFHMLICMWTSQQPTSRWEHQGWKRFLHSTFLPPLGFQGLTWLLLLTILPYQLLYLTMAPNSISWQVLLADGRRWGVMKPPWVWRRGVGVGHRIPSGRGQKCRRPESGKFSCSQGENQHSELSEPRRLLPSGLRGKS